MSMRRIQVACGGRLLRSRRPLQPPPPPPTSRSQLARFSAASVARSSSDAGGSSKNEWDWARFPPPPIVGSSAEEEKDYTVTVKVPRPARPPNEPVETKRARLVWMSRKRGILETDLLLSTFAAKHLATMDAVALEQYDSLLEENDWDIYYWTTGARQPPPEVKEMVFWEALVEHSKNKARAILRMPDV